MAMEFKTLDVENCFERLTIRVHTNFGWKLKSSQRVYDRNTRLENRNGDTYAVTETMDFTKLVFERDTEMKHYYALKDLEDEYYRCEDALKVLKTPKYSSSVTIEEWAKKASPIVKKIRRKALYFVIPALIGMAVVIAILSVIATSIDDTPLIEQIKDAGITLIFFSSVVGSIFGGCVYNKSIDSINEKALKKALADHSSEEWTELKRQYDEVHSEAETYEFLSERRAECEKEASKLVE